MISRKTSYAIRAAKPVRKAAPDAAYLVAMMTPAVLGLAAIAACTARFMGVTP